MNKPRLEWKVGLFIFIGLALLAVLLVEFSKGTTFFRPTYQIYLRAANVGGLKVRASVLMSGVQVGSVSDIKLSPTGTNVTIALQIYSQYEIHKDARFVIELSGFLGDTYVAIIPTENKDGVFHDGEEAQAEPPFNIQEFTRSATTFIQRVDETIKKLNDSLADVRRIVLNPQTLTNLSAAAVNLRLASERAVAAVDNINMVVSTNSPAISASSSNLVVFSEQLNRIADGLKGVLATNSPDINVTVKNLESSSEVLKNVLNDMQAGKGLAGNVLRNQQLATNVSQIANNLSITSSNLNRLGLWGILWKHKPPKTNAPPLSPPPVTSPKNPFESD